MLPVECRKTCKHCEARENYPLYHVTDHEVFYWLVYLEIVIFKADMITVWCGIYFNEKVFGVDKTEEGIL